jgi:hypothetical protein
MLNRRLKEIPLPKDEDEATLSAAIKEERALAHEELLNDTQDIREIPAHLLLDESDMPLAGKGETNQLMQAAVASIKYNLGFLYIGDAEGDEITEAED